MSEKSRIPLSTLSKVEHDRLTLTYDKLYQVSQRLGIPISELFAESGGGVTAANELRLIAIHLLHSDFATGKGVLNFIRDQINKSEFCCCTTLGRCEPDAKLIAVLQRHN